MIRHFFEALKMEKYYLLIAVLLFLGSSLFGILFFDQVSSMLKEAGVFEQLEQVVKKVEKTPTFTNAFMMIFVNNTTVSLLAIGSGIIFGIYPIMILINNGLLLSVSLLLGASQTNVHPLMLFLTTILPHGIFELPAILIGSALGIHLGIALFRALLALFISKNREKIVAEWKGIGQRFFVIIFGVIVCLFFAALIEAGLLVLMYSL